ncbi:MAG: NYN domain-containing protein [Candidatus Peribacteraceae bacterium]|nr:NYN domain-containing protein [Candidatus Peribacteraceae bacterium]
MKLKKDLQSRKKLNKIRTINPPAAGRASEHRRVFFVYIDGSNFYHRIKKCGIEEKHFSYREFVNCLVGEPVENVKYYIGKVQAKKEDKKGQKLRAAQQARFAKLELAGFDIFKGRLLKVEGKYIEKGVDVRLGLDIAVDAIEDSYDEAFLISSDGDLAPAVEYAIKKKNKKIIYIAFEGSKFSYHLIQTASATRFVKTAELEKFVLKSE